MRHPSLRLALFAFLAVAFGFVVSAIPSPADVGTFWVGNFSSPWAVIAFLTGWAQPSRPRAALGGAVALVACVLGFYSRFLFVDAARMGLPDTTPLSALAAAALLSWLVFAGPWLLLAVAAGGAYGLLGRWWGDSRAVLPGAALALAFIVEPAAWWLYRGFLQGPALIWAVEIALGLVVLGWVAITRSPRPGSSPQPS